MRHFTVRAHVKAGQPLRLEIPESFEGGPADIIVTRRQRPATAMDSQSGSIADFLDDASPRRLPPRSKEDIDLELEEERSSWD